MPIGDTAYGDATYGGQPYGGTMPLPFAITTTSLPNGSVLSLYLQTVAVFGGTAPYSWALASGALPLGMTLSPSTGIISGTPTVAGFSSFTITASDSGGNVDSQALSILITPAASLPPVIGPPMSAAFQEALQQPNLEVVSYAEIWSGINPTPAITAVGPGNFYFGTGLKVATANPTAIGDVLVLALAFQGASAKPAATNVSGGGVTTWNRLSWSNPGSNRNDAELWWGIITTPGTANITVTAATASGFNVLYVNQFTTGGLGTWGTDGTGAASTDTGLNAFSGKFPTVTPVGQGELYLGCMCTSAFGPNVLNGTTPGYGYQVMSALLFAYNPFAAQPSIMNPGWTTTPQPNPLGWAACSALLTSTAPVGQNVLLEGPLQLLSGSVTADRSNAIRRSASSVTMLSNAAGDTDLLPLVNGTGDLFPNGAELALYKGLRYPNGNVEVARQGRFLLEEADVNNDGTGVTIPLTMKDRGETISRAQFTAPYQTDGVSTTDVAIQQLIASRVPGLTYAFTPSTVVPPVSTWNVGDDPWAAAMQLAVGASMELFPDVAGTLVLKPTPNPSSSVPVAEYIEGTPIAPTKLVRTVSNANVPNVVIITASGSNVPVPIQMFWWDNNPGNKTFYAYGSVPSTLLPVQDPTSTYPMTVLNISSSTLSTVEEVTALIFQTVTQVQGAFETAQITVRDDPARDVDDVVLTQRAVAGILVPTAYVLDSVAIDLGPKSGTQMMGRLVT